MKILNYFNQEQIISNHVSFKPITEEEIREALINWGKGLVSIANAYAEEKDYMAIARNVIERCYAYDIGPVLFKPTLASEVMFRTTFEGALSYFVSGNSNFPEDTGFALKPWVQADFELAGIVHGCSQGVAMGNKLLLDKSKNITVANFTMGFIRDDRGNLKINLHHSSLPYVRS